MLETGAVQCRSSHSYSSSVMNLADGFVNRQVRLAPSLNLLRFMHLTRHSQAFGAD